MTHKIAKKIRRYFLTGIAVLTPIVLTVYIFWKIFIVFDNWMAGILQFLFVRVLGITNYYHRIPGIGILVMILLIILAGILTRMYIGRKLLALGNWIVGKIPFFNSIYNTLKQIVEALFSDKGEVFRKAVLIEYPRKGIYCIAFMTQDTRGEVQERSTKDLISVFLPTTPNPTSGFLLFIPKEDAVELDMPIEEAVKLVISGGAIQIDEKKPDHKPKSSKTFDSFFSFLNKRKKHKQRT
ncbi:hypothetical protein BMS3Abin05_02688 [bacterium BMS3Abin05]|nr:hypothetical protein BMS3Abin05_02688 [bacterium BMS3Abin05]GBE27228.1 hypothetical protein BMS3Bbin03_01152 [bacterium BMS3Bbin03]HDK35369.1 DUF502 domain-containing protein [Bacteroidota bacterium]